MNFLKTFYEIEIALIIVVLNIYLFQFMNSIYFAILFGMFSILIVLSLIITPILLKERVNTFKMLIEYFYLVMSLITMFLLFAFYMLRSVL